MSTVHVKPLILASRSPRRKELLAQAGIFAEVVPPGIDEEAVIREVDNRTPSSTARMLAEKKAAFVYEWNPSRAVLGADTVVVLDGNLLLGIPKNDDEAAEMLWRLSGRAHTVITAVAIFYLAQRFVAHDETTVVFRQLSESEIAAYVGSGEGRDKAGAYAFQGKGRGLIAEYRGDPETVVGLPTKLVKEGLREVGFYE